MVLTDETRIRCSKATRRMVKACKRGGEDYDTVLQKMVEQYDPEESAETPESGL